MAQIAFWSTFHGQTATTSNAISAAVYTAMNYKMKILLTHSQYGKSSMENAFLSKSEEKELSKFNDIGIDSLERLVKSGNLNKNDFVNYTKSIITNRLDLLTGSTKLRKDLFNNIYETIIDIMNCANECYDLIFIDVNSGSKDKITEKVLKQSDLIVINLNQNEKVLQEFFSTKDELEVLKDKQIILNIGRYDPNSKCTCKYIKNTYGWKDEIYTVPYNTTFMDAFNNHDIVKFFYSNNKALKYHDTQFFMSEIERLSNRMVEDISVENLNYKPLKKVGIIKSIFNLG